MIAANMLDYVAAFAALPLYWTWVLMMCLSICRERKPERMFGKFIGTLIGCAMWPVIASLSRL